jgi:hypothetical protein
MKQRVRRTGIRVRAAVQKLGVPLLLLLAAHGWGAPVSGSARAAVAKPDGCVRGSRRIGTMQDAALGRRWAVVVNCAHPSWPAHLEPARAWQALPLWVPAGTGVRVRAKSGHVVMNLTGKTVMPGRVGQIVLVQLRGGSRVEARLEDAGVAALVPRRNWRQW